MTRRGKKQPKLHVSLSLRLNLLSTSTFTPPDHSLCRFTLQYSKGPQEAKWNRANVKPVNRDIVTIKYEEEEMGQGSTRERGLGTALDNAIEDVKKRYLLNLSQVRVDI